MDGSGLESMRVDRNGSAWTGMDMNGYDWI